MINRRDSLKALLIGSVGATTLTLGVTGCKEEIEVPLVETNKGYGRITSEIAHDERLEAQGPFFTSVELSLIATLCDLVLPATPTAGSATAAEVPAFIDFIVKDLPYHQIPIQGGLMWINGESNKRYNKIFEDCSSNEQKQILDDIAYPSTEKTQQFDAGRKFFNKFRGLVLTGYYTTKIGIDDLGYVGNRPNLWDGVPPSVLAKHGLDYDENMKGRYINHDSRDTKATWDENGNLLT